MSEAATLPAILDEDERPAPQVAPMLPVEGHIVAATRALEAAKQQCDRALFILEHLPRNRDDAFAALSAANAATVRAYNAYANYDAVRCCEGQA